MGKGRAGSTTNDRLRRRPETAKALVHRRVPRFLVAMAMTSPREARPVSARAFGSHLGASPWLTSRRSWRSVLRRTESAVAGPLLGHNRGEGGNEMKDLLSAAFVRLQPNGRLPRLAVLTSFGVIVLLSGVVAGNGVARGPSFAGQTTRPRGTTSAKNRRFRVSRYPRKGHATERPSRARPPRLTP